MPAPNQGFHMCGRRRPAYARGRTWTIGKVPRSGMIRRDTRRMLDRVRSQQRSLLLTPRTPVHPPPGYLVGSPGMAAAAQILTRAQQGCAPHTREALPSRGGGVIKRLPGFQFNRCKRGGHGNLHETTNDAPLSVAPLVLPQSVHRRLSAQGLTHPLTPVRSHRLHLNRGTYAPRSSGALITHRVGELTRAPRPRRPNTNKHAPRAAASPNHQEQGQSPSSAGRHRTRRRLPGLGELYSRTTLAGGRAMASTSGPGPASPPPLPPPYPPEHAPKPPQRTPLRLFPPSLPLPLPLLRGLRPRVPSRVPCPLVRQSLPPLPTPAAGKGSQSRGAFVPEFHG